MPIDFMLGVIGLCGGLLCAVADIFLDLKGEGNEKYGPSGIMDSNWEKMSLWRFKASIWLAAVAVPMYLMGTVALYRQMALTQAAVANVFGICAVIGSCSTLFIHCTLCYLPIISKTLTAKKVSRDAIESTVLVLYKAMIVPFLAFWVLLVVGLSGLATYAILSGVLALPGWFVLLTPFSLTVVGALLRLVNKKVFADLPGICMPSLGIAMMGLMAALNAVV